MAHTLPPRPTALLTIVLALAGAVPAAGAQQVQLQGPRVRTSDAPIRAAIALGIERSPTFRQRLAQIEATDGLVYVEAGTCGNNSVSACLLTSLVLAGPSRLLRVLVDLRKLKGCTLVATIGHELQHAIEVLDDPNVRSGEAMYFLFTRIGPVSSGAFETKAARYTSRDVGREACRN